MWSCSDLVLFVTAGVSFNLGSAFWF
jgi:hypothetical protein